MSIIFDNHIGHLAYKRTKREVPTHYFTSCAVDVHPIKYFANSLQDATKNCQVRTHGAKKRTAVSPIVITETLLNRAL